MTAINQLMDEIETLPAEYFQEIIDFVKSLKSKKLSSIPEAMILSEQALAKDWDSPEENEAWASL